MTPLVVRAVVPGHVCIPHTPVMLDALLMWAAAMRDGLPPLLDDAAPPIEIPLAKSECGRIFLCSEAQYQWEEHDLHWLNRRFPVAEAQAMGESKMRRLNIAAGATKSYRLPMEVGYLRDSLVEWYAVGDADAVLELLSLVTHLGKKRSVGKGEVQSWSVTRDVAPWDGFPVVREGRPLRALPLDWPGVRDADRARRVLSPPYWQRWREEEALVGVRDDAAA